MSILKTPVSDKDHWQGNANAIVELVEYGDYECPYCGSAYPIIKDIQRLMGDDLKFVFRNFPLSSIHPHARSAAQAAEASGLQDKFWEMHDIIFEHQQELEPPDLFAYAASIGLDVKKFRKDVQLDYLLEKIDADLESGVRSGVNGTPSFFIRGKKWEGNWEDRDTFLQYLRAQKGK